MSEKTPNQAEPKLRSTKKKSISPVFWWNLSLLVFAAIATTFIIGFKLEEQLAKEFIIGEPAPRSLFSPFEFTYENKEATTANREAKMAEVLPVYHLNPKSETEVQSKASELFKKLKEYQALQSTPAAKPSELGELPIKLSKQNTDSLLENPHLEEVEAQSAALFHKVMDRGVVDEKELEKLQKSSVKSITLIRDADKKESTADLSALRTLAQLKANWDAELPAEIAKNKNLKGILSELAQNAVTPNLSRDEESFQARRKKAYDSADTVEETIMKSELLVQRGMKILPIDKLRIEQLEKKSSAHKVLNQLLANGVLVFLTYGLIFIYLWMLDRKVLFSGRKVTFVVAVFCMTVLISKTIGSWPGSSYYLMPLALAPLLFVMLSGPKYGFVSAAAMAVFAGPLSEYSAEVILCALISGFAATFAGYKVRKRFQFLKVGFSLGLAYAAALFAFRVFHEYPVNESFQLSALGFANGLLITMPLAFLLLPILEQVFNLVTDISLLELSDLNHPILKRMIVEAPGTYHHSLVVSTLAEAACETIGANALLARVGCYFHDIGKIARAEFFTENMKSQLESKHHELTPTMSCLIIMNHVKDGIELGRKYKLKERILQFIPEHQGTGVIYYFYRKALDHVKSPEKVNPNDFRYPGPKPQSKETAVALLADSTEAASRSLKQPSPESIRQLVRKIINDKFIDGQLDECDLTLRDLHKIQQSFISNLMAIFHTRVHYPVEANPSPDRPDLFEEEQFEKFRIQLPKDDDPC